MAGLGIGLHHQDNANSHEGPERNQTMEHTKTYAEQDSTMIAPHETDAPQNLQVCYSGMDNGRFVLGDGTITATSADMMQIHGDCPVTLGMELALMVAFPHSDDHLYLVGGQVSSATLHSFKMDLQQVPETTREHLETLAQGCRETPADFCYAA
jgi:hypothetical protein